MPDATAVRWYHGGVPGLERGEKILPPSATGAVSLSDVALRCGNEDLKDKTLAVHRQDRVYLVRSLAWARFYASVHPAFGGAARGGDLYECAPDGGGENDPDWLGEPGVSMAFESAVVVRIVERRVPRPDPRLLAQMEAAS